MRDLVSELKGKIGQIVEGGGEKAVLRHTSRGKLLARERINRECSNNLVTISFYAFILIMDNNISVQVCWTPRRHFWNCHNSQLTNFTGKMKYVSLKNALAAAIFIDLLIASFMGPTYIYCLEVFWH